MTDPREPRTQTGRDLDHMWGAKIDRLAWREAIVAIEDEAAERATPATPSLDVERLAEAIHSEFSDLAWCEPDWSECDQALDWTTGAENVAAKYAALSPEQEGTR